jgi:hypothetical protein
LANKREQGRIEAGASGEKSSLQIRTWLVGPLPTYRVQTINRRGVEHHTLRIGLAKIRSARQRLEEVERRPFPRRRYIKIFNSNLYPYNARKPTIENEEFTNKGVWRL